MKGAFFVTGQGRSGTMWLAQVLNKALGVRGHHEPIQADVHVYVLIYRGELSGRYYLTDR